MDETIFDKINDVDLKKTMENSYIDYAMSVIAARALPDVRDGLKPVQRRILYAMVELNNGPDKPHRKCARIVGDTMGKFHPHGDSSIYGALVNMAQDWSFRCPLVDGHGNFGSVDGDGAAAMRYTEARLSKISMEMLADINKDTVEFIPNFDETEKEPTVLPARFPNLLVNGTTGIAVGMATNIPPHNLKESINAVIKIIENKIENQDTSIEELMEIVKGPDFPTGALILGRRGINQAYRTGRGKVVVRAVTNIEPMPNGKNRIIATELPYLVNKAKLIEKIADLVKDKKIEGITDLRDESNREGTRVVIELRKDVNPNVILNQLYKHTQLQDTFGVIMLALVNNEPKVLTLKELLTLYLDHQEDVVTRRTKYDLNKAEERAHILKGLLIALDYIDEVISIIRSSKSVAQAKESLIIRFGLDDVQAQAIVDMRLRALTGLEREKLQDEYDELMERIAYFKEILGDEKKLLGVIKDEITVIRDKYGDERRTQIGMDELDFTDEDLIPDETSVVARTHMGYIKRMDLENFKVQHRGGKGIKGMQTIDEDFMEDLFMTTTHHVILFFTTKGRVYRLKGYEIPEASRIARGTAIVNLLQLQPDEKISAILTMKEFDDKHYIFMATKQGIIKKTQISDFANIRKSGIQAISFREDDELINVVITDGNDEILMFTKNGMSIHFKEEEVRPTGRSSIGVMGMRLSDEDEIVSMQKAGAGKMMLAVAENGFGKLTDVDEFGIQHRGGKGVLCYKIAPKTGNLGGVKMVESEDEILLITNEGIVIRTEVEGIRKVGRIASGVKLININVEEGIKVASVMKVQNFGTDEAIEEMEAELEKEIEEELQHELDNELTQEFQQETDENISNNSDESESENNN